MARDSARSGRSRTAGGGSVGSPAPSKGFRGTNAGQVGAKKVYFNQKVKMVEFPAGGGFLAMRMISDPIPDVQYRIDIVKKDESVIDIGKTPLNFDREADTFDTTIECPYADMKNPKRMAKHYYVLVIVRELQDNEPRRLPELSANEKKTGYFDSAASSSWSPVRVLRLTDRMAGKVGKLEETNKVKTKKGVMVMPLADPEYGRDILMSYDKNAKVAADTYDVQLDQSSGHTPLSKTELKYLKWDIMGNLDVPESYAEAVKEVESMESRAPDSEEAEEEGKKAGRDLDRGSRKKRESDKPIRGSSRRDKEEKTSRSSKSSKSEKSGKSSVSDRRAARSSKDKTSSKRDKTSSKTDRKSRR